jgi:hypothetical protein
LIFRSGIHAGQKAGVTFGIAGRARSLGVRFLAELLDLSFRWTGLHFVTWIVT